MAPPSDRDQKVMDEFRASGGSSATFGSDRPIVLLGTKGRKSGVLHTTPVMYRRDGASVVVFASKAGAPTSPNWFHNLVANPTVTLEVGTDKYEATAAVATGAERDRLYEAQSKEFPQFAEYQKKTTRQIPVVLLTKKS